MIRMGPPQQGHGSRRVSGIASASGPGVFRAMHAQHGADLRDIGLAGRTGQQAVVSDAVEPVHCPAGDCVTPKACFQHDAICQVSVLVKLDIRPISVDRAVMRWP